MTTTLDQQLICDDAERRAFRIGDDGISRQFQSGIYVPLNNELISGNDDSEIVANGNIALTWAQTSLDAVVNTTGEETPEADDDTVEFAELSGTFGLRGAVTLELAARTSGAFSQRVNLLTLPATPFNAGPVTVTPWVIIGLRISGDAEAGAAISLVAPFNVRALLSAIGGQRPAMVATEDPAFACEVGPPNPTEALALSVEVGLEVAVALMLSYQGVPLGGPVLVTSAGLQLDLDPTGVDPSGEVTIKYGWSRPPISDPLGAPRPPRRLNDLVAPITLDLGAATTTVLGTPSRWSRAYDIAGDDDVAGVATDGATLFVAEGGDNFDWVAALDGGGSPLWENVPVATSEYVALTAVPNGDLVLVETTTESIRVERRDVSGSPLSAVELGPISHPTVAAAVTVPSGIVLAGTTSDISLVSGVVLQLDDSGDIAWQVRLDLDPEGPFSSINITGAAALPDGDVLVVGHVHHRPENAGRHNEALVVHVGIDGVVRTAFTIAGTFSLNAAAVAIQPDGRTYVVTGDLVVDDNGLRPVNPWAAVVALDLAGQHVMISSSTYLDRDDSESRASSWAKGAAAVGLGDFAIVGHGLRTLDGSATWESWLMRIDDSGMPLWAKSVVSEPGADDRLRGVVALDRGIAAFGDARSAQANDTSTYHDLWIVGTDVDGMVHFADDSPFTMVNGTVEWTTYDDHTAATIELLSSDPGLGAAAVNPPVVAPSTATVIELSQFAGPFRRTA